MESRPIRIIQIVGRIDHGKADLRTLCEVHRLMDDEPTMLHRGS